MGDVCENDEQKAVVKNRAKRILEVVDKWMSQWDAYRSWDNILLIEKGLLHT